MCLRIRPVSPNVVVSLFVCRTYLRKKLLDTTTWWHDEGRFAHCWSYGILLFISYTCIRTSRTINQWAGWSEAVSHNNGTTQLQPHVEDRKVEHGSWSNDPNDPNVPLLLGTKELVSAVEQRQPATCWVSAGRSQEPHLSGLRHHTTATSPTRQDTSAIVLYLDIF